MSLVSKTSCPSRRSRRPCRPTCTRSWRRSWGWQASRSPASVALHRRCRSFTAAVEGRGAQHAGCTRGAACDEPASCRRPARRLEECCPVHTCNHGFTHCSVLASLHEPAGNRCGASVATSRDWVPTVASAAAPRTIAAVPTASAASGASCVMRMEAGLSALGDRAPSCFAAAGPGPLPSPAAVSPNQ